VEGGPGEKVGDLSEYWGVTIERRLTMKRPILSWFVMAVVLLTGGAAVAAELNCEVSDAEGDALWQSEGAYP
jgi:hypothetical protein